MKIWYLPENRTTETFGGTTFIVIVFWVEGNFQFFRDKTAGSKGMSHQSDFSLKRYEEEALMV